MTPQPPKHPIRSSSGVFACSCGHVQLCDPLATRVTCKGCGKTAESPKPEQYVRMIPVATPPDPKAQVSA